MKTHSHWKLWVGGLVAAMAGGCSTVCGPMEHTDLLHDSLCSSGFGDYLSELTNPIPRVDLRADAAGQKPPLRLRLVIRRKGAERPLPLVAAPSVDLMTDGGPWQAVPARLGAEDIELPRDIEPLQPGPWNARVTVADLQLGAQEGQKPRLLLDENSPLLPRAFRRPVFDGARSLSLPLGPVSPRSGSVTGRSTVQVAGPYGLTNRLLVTESMSTGVGPVRWLELLQGQASGTLAYDMNGAWRAEQQRQQEGPSALLTLAKGAVLVYDDDATTMRRDLSLLPFSGARQGGLSRQKDITIPTAATALAACAEEAVVMLADSDSVHFFGVDAAAASGPLRLLAKRAVKSAPPVIAARDVAAPVPTQKLARFFAALAGSDGSVELVALDGSTVTTAATLKLPGPVSALALADLDSDGLQDLVYALSSSTPGEDGKLGWAPQHPDGSFPDFLPLAIQAAGAVSLSVGDLNDDRSPDLAVAASQGATRNVTVFWNQPG